MLAARMGTGNRNTGAGEALLYQSGHIILVTLTEASTVHKIPAAEFKARCLAVMDQVSESGQPVIITKHGKAVVKLVPVEVGDDEIFGFMAGKARIVGDIESSAPRSDWKLR